MQKIAKNDLKRVVVGYRTMTKKMEKAFSNWGFVIEKTSGHTKLFLNGNYFTTLSCTGSDRKAGNAKVSEIWNRLPNEMKEISVKQVVTPKKVKVVKKSDCFTLQEVSELLDTDTLSVMKVIDSLNLWGKLPKSKYGHLLVTQAFADTISERLSSNHK